MFRRLWIWAPPVLVCCRAVIDMQFCRHVIDKRKSCRCRHKKYFITYIDMSFQLNGTLKYLRNNEIMSNFSRDTTIVVFCQPSFMLRSQCELYFRVCSISRLFVLWILMNQSFQSPHPEVGMVSLLYNSATEQQMVFVQNVKLYYVDMSLTCQDFFTNVLTWKKDLDDSPSVSICEHDALFLIAVTTPWSV